MRYWVYIHTCKDNGKKYVGVTTRVKPELRWGKNGAKYHQNKHFYSAILKYGWDNFQHEVFEVDSAEEMYRKEVELISFYHSNDPEFGYNNSSGGESGHLGCKHSEETRKKLKEASKKKWADPEYRKRVSEALKKVQKKVHSDPEYLRKQSEVHSDPEFRRKISEANKKKWSDPEYRKKQSEARKGQVRSEEARKHLAEANKKKWSDPEYLRKQSEVRSDPEFRKKRSEALKERYSDPEFRKKMAEVQKKVHSDPEYRKKLSESHKGKPKPRVKIQLPDGTVLEITKPLLTRHYINKGKKFEYVD